MNSSVVCYILLNAFFAIAQELSYTKGHFFNEIRGSDEDETKSHQTIITEEIFHCEGNDSCLYLVKEEAASKYKRVSVNELVSEKDSFNAILEKHQPTGFCKDIYNFGVRKSGIYEISIPYKYDKFKVYCDMETDGGGWTVIQRRVDSTTSFNRNWTDYQNGFGDPEKNMWIGLEIIHYLAGPDGNSTLRIDLKHLSNPDAHYFVKYGKFKINNKADGYRLHVSEYSGNAGDAFTVASSHMITNGMQFSTFDRDNDLDGARSCAQIYSGGWWHKACFNCNLNGDFPNIISTDSKYITWGTINGAHGNIFYSEMKIRRN